MNFAIYWNGQLGSDNIVAGFDVIGGIQAEKVRVAFIYLVRGQRTELAVRAGVTEVKRKLAGLHLNLQIVGLGSGKINAGPCLLPEHTQRQYFSAHQNKSRGHHDFGAARQVTYFGALFTRGKSPDKESQEKLSSQESKPAFRHGVGKLLVNGVPVRGDFLTLHILVSHD